MDWDRVIYNGTVVNDDGMQRADIYIRDASNPPSRPSACPAPSAKPPTLLAAISCPA